MDVVHVYNARFVSEDTNMWDGNESYGMYSSLEGAQKALEKTFRTKDDDCRWLPVGTSWTGVDAEARTWKLVTLDDGETWEDYELDEDGEFCDDYGFGQYVIEEELRNA